MRVERALDGARPSRPAHPAMARSRRSAGAPPPTSPTTWWRPGCGWRGASCGGRSLRWSRPCVRPDDRERALLAEQLDYGTRPRGSRRAGRAPRRPTVDRLPSRRPRCRGSTPASCCAGSTRRSARCPALEFLIPMPPDGVRRPGRWRVGGGARRPPTTEETTDVPVLPEPSRTTPRRSRRWRAWTRPSASRSWHGSAPSTTRWSSRPPRPSGRGSRSAPAGAPGVISRPSRRHSRRASTIAVGVLGREHRRAGHEHVGAGLGAALDGLEGDAAVDLEPGLEAVPVHQLAGRAGSSAAQVEELLAAEARLDGHQQHHVELGEQVLVGLDRRRRPQRHAGPGAVAAQISRASRTGAAAASTWKVTEPAPASTYASASRSASVDHQVGVERARPSPARAPRPSSARRSGWGRSGCPSRRRAPSRRWGSARPRRRAWRSRRSGCSA